MSEKQLTINYPIPVKLNSNESYITKLTKALSEDLDFSNQKSDSYSHNIHSFPAKFPPQIPRKFIEELTEENEVVLDPMAGSGTTILEAYLLNRKAIGFDIDPMALLITRSKVSNIDTNKTIRLCKSIVEAVRSEVKMNPTELDKKLSSAWDPKTKEFIDYWFAPETQRELISLISEIIKIEDTEIKQFFLMTFSSIIITKSGGVSLAFDLGHTRPHRAKVVISESGKVLIGEDELKIGNKRTTLLTKNVRSAVIDFEKKALQNIKKLTLPKIDTLQPTIEYGTVEKLPLESNSVDLIVTSPPYASNAIDYMRAHKFSLVWMNYSVEELTQKRRQYIGGENVNDICFEPLPEYCEEIVQAISKIKPKEGEIVRRYYSEMKRALNEMFRVLRPNKAAILVVGSSILCGIDTQTQDCLVEIGKEIGFLNPYTGVRNIDRNKRMLPAGNSTDKDSQIQQRMHQEYVIGFYKP